MAAQIDRSIPVIFIDTGKLFWETLSYRSKLVDRLGLTDIRTIQPDADDLRLLRSAGPTAQDRSRSCAATSAKSCRSKARCRASMPGSRDANATMAEPVPVSLPSNSPKDVSKSSRWLVSQPAISKPICSTMTFRRHPLVEQGYRSIGCMPCTVKGGSTDNPRAGRWFGTGEDRMRHSLDR